MANSMAGSFVGFFGVESLKVHSRTTRHIYARHDPYRRPPLVRGQNRYPNQAPPRPLPRTDRPPLCSWVSTAPCAGEDPRATGYILPPARGMTTTPPRHAAACQSGLMGRIANPSYARHGASAQLLVPDLCLTTQPLTVATGSPHGLCWNAVGVPPKSAPITGDAWLCRRVRHPPARPAPPPHQARTPRA